MSVSRAWLSLSALLLACGSTTSPCGPTSGEVVNVVDGDTIDLKTGERIRYLLVDTPETTSGKNDCYGQEAVARNRALVLNKNVTLKYDTECKDRFGRLLAYVSVGAVEVNRTLVDEGLACVLYVAPSGKSREDEFVGYELAAKSDRKGMWGSCTVIACD